MNVKSMRKTDNQIKSDNKQDVLQYASKISGLSDNA